MEALGIISWLIGLLFIINALDYMRKTIRQRETQITQMDRFLELYKKANGLNAVSGSQEGTSKN